MTWFALNFVLCTMPPICIFWLNSYDDLIRKRFDGTYAPIMYLTWITNLITLFCRNRIIKVNNMGIGQLNEADIIESSFGKDEAFQPKEESPREEKEEAETKEDTKIKSVLPSDKIKAIPFLEHYVEMDSVIDFDRIYVQIPQVIMMLISTVLYCKLEGRELVYALYIPFDIMLNACNFIFFWFYYYREQEIDENAQRVAMRLDRMDNKAMSLEEPLVSNFNTLDLTPQDSQTSFSV